MFDNFDNKKIKTPRQKKEGNRIVKAKAGRKRQPNMKKYLFSMDATLHTKLSGHAKSTGINKSSIVTRLVYSYIKEVEQENFKKSLARKMKYEGISDTIISRVTDIPLSELKMY